MWSAAAAILMLLTTPSALLAASGRETPPGGAQPALARQPPSGGVAPATHGAAAGSSGLASLAREGRWSEILEIAQRREAQLPLTGIQALVAAEAALRLGEPGLRERYLEGALGAKAAAPVARVELARSILPERPERCVELVLPLLRRSPSREIRREAVALAAKAVGAGIPATLRSRLGRELRRLPQSSRRSLEVALALAGKHPHAGLLRILQRDRTDLADLRAAEALLEPGPANAKERWLVARSLYRHARYGEALALVEGLTKGRRRGIVLWKARFLRGRCLFRLERWRQAASWYRKAQAAASRREDRARLLVHEARALELAGDLARATARAGRAVATRPSDDRRLFFGRLELARGRRKNAHAVFARLRRRSARDRGRLLEAIDAQARGERGAAIGKLLSITGRSWRGPALVLAAGAVLEQGEPSRAAVLLERAAQGHLHGFWALASLRLAGKVPLTERQRWSAGLHAELAAAPSQGRSAVLHYSSLVTGPADRVALREAAGRLLGLQGHATSMAWRSPLARELWENGLAGSAARWVPRGFPGVTSFEAAWSARQLLLAGHPSWAIRLAHAALQRLQPELPADLVPVPAQRSLFPLPHPAPVAQAADRQGLPWTVLAAVVREESRWNPRALSAVGARGLTQLMPATARRVATRLQRTPPSPNELFDPATALDLGAAELARLLRAFGGRRAPAIAAYNAGEPQARLWLRQAGPRSGDAWYVATIGFGATRAYTSDVFWAEQAYGQIWNGITGEGEGPGRSSRLSGALRAAPESSRPASTSHRRSTARSPR